MGIRREQTVEHPIGDVFGWFARPGAFTRLSAPWVPMTLLSEASSLADGVAVLGLPGGLRWVARHDPTGYREGRRFVDEVAPGDSLRSRPAGLMRWRHVHTFEPLGDDRTVVTDRVDTPVPEALLAEQFAYRHRQLSADLDAHRRARDSGRVPSTIAITGSSGTVGDALTAFLSTGGHRVLRLVRRDPAGPDERRWDPDRPDSGELAGVDAVIHLAGEPIAGRFTDAHKRAIADSRITPTRLLSLAAADAGVPVFVSASAVGRYGRDRGDELLTETDAGPPVDDFLAGVVRDWEEAAHAGGDRMRIVTVRTGIVQSPRGGTLALLAPLFRLGLGGRLGDGTGWLPWIGVDDLVDVYHRALWDETLSGPVNAVAPGIVRNSEYTRTLGAVLRRPAVLPVPRFGPALLLGEEGARDLAFANQRVHPAALLERGHRFRTPGLDTALRHLLGRSGA